MAPSTSLRSTRAPDFSSRLRTSIRGKPEGLRNPRLDGEAGLGGGQQSGVVALGSKVVSETSGSEGLDAVVDLGGGPSGAGCAALRPEKGRPGQAIGLARFVRARFVQTQFVQRRFDDAGSKCWRRR